MILTSCLIQIAAFQNTQFKSVQCLKLDENVMTFDCCNMKVCSRNTSFANLGSVLSCPLMKSLNVNSFCD